ncbi:mitochondrial proton/calcium exchanger protein [Anabrus simplex]|uniref:mitochondrial proton/calcium exchanger protein n=1 Tax=Anabrus simplex TaxID=316456 RepID=UPI0035A326EB
MHAFLNSHKSIAAKAKSIVQNGCLCEHSNYLNYKFGGRLGAPSPYFLCPVTSARLYSKFFKVYCNDSEEKLKVCEFNRKCSFYSLQISPISSTFSGSSLVVVREFHVGSRLHGEPLKPSSKVEKTVQALKEDLKESDKPPPPVDKVVPVKKPLKQKIIDEILHYYHGFRLLFIDINISRKLVWRVLKGKSLTRREHRLLVRTVSDMFRLVPFSVFIIVPFMEFLLPVAIKFFPGMLPSTFQTATERDDKLKQSLKVKLEMAKFLQQTLDDMAVQGTGGRSESAKEFAEFFNKVRSSGEPASNEEIMKFSKLFEDEITLDSLSRQQLIALCRVLEMQTLGTNNFLRFQLRMKLRSLAADDKMIQKEGIDSLTPAELQQACRARGMRAYGISEARLKSQLAQWLDLSLNEKVPPSLLLLSRALLLPDTIPASDQLKATISVLPDSVVTQTQAAISEREGKIDNKTKIEVIKEEERRIREERQEMREEENKLKKMKEAEELIDKAPIIGEAEKELSDVAPLAVKFEASQSDKKVKELSSSDLETLESALDSIGKEKKKLLVEKEELDDLKEELAEYQEGVDDLQQVLSNVGDSKGKLKESKAAKRLFKQVNSMIGKMDAVLTELERKEQKLKEDLASKDKMEAVETKKKSEQLVGIEELITAIKQIQKVPDDSLVERISEVLAKMDVDRDGAIRVDDVLKVIELVSNENVHLNKKHIDEILELMSKEEMIELEEQIGKVLEKETMQQAAKEKAHKPSEKVQAQPDDNTKTPADSGSTPKAAMAVASSTTSAKCLPKDSSDTSKKL